MYIHDDGNIRLNFIHPKQILNIFRQLCSGKATAYEELCAAFDQQTQDGGDMSTYDRLLQRCIDAIAATFQKRVAAGLQDSRSFIIPEENEQPNAMSEFELVTWR